MGSRTETAAGSYSITIPAGVTLLTVQLWAGGAGGSGRGTSQEDGGGGGGGGAYTTVQWAVVPGNSYDFVVGAGGTGGTGLNAGNNGGDSWFQSAVHVLAAGGTGSPAGTSTTPGTGGAGGQSSAGLPTSGTGLARFSGGTGGAGRNNANGNSGGGGSSAGTAANGGAGGAGGGSPGTAGVAPAGGGNGAIGVAGNASNHGTTATALGGGGGGAGDSADGVASTNGGGGFAGKVTLTWEDAPTITDVETDEAFTDQDTGVTITGTNFLATQATGLVQLASTSDYATATKVNQTVTSWGTTSIDFTASLGGLTPGTLYLFVTNDGASRSTGFAVTVTAMAVIVDLASSLTTQTAVSAALARSAEISAPVMTESQILADLAITVVTVVIPPSSEWQIATVTLTSLSGPTAVAPALIPANCIVWGVETVVVEEMTGVTSFDCGDGTHEDRWGKSLSPGAASISGLPELIITSPPYYGPATDVILRARGGEFTAGEVTITVYYATLSQGLHDQPWLTATTTLSALSGASVTATNLIPGNCYVLGVQAEVLTAITGATGFDCGDGLSPDEHQTRWGDNISVADETLTDIGDFTITSVPRYGAAHDVVLVARGGNFTGGSVALTVYYANLTQTWGTAEVPTLNLSGASKTVELVPEAAWLIGVELEVLTEVTGATGINIGDGTDTTRWGQAISPTLATLTTIGDFFPTSLPNTTSPLSVTLTAVGGSFTGGQVRLTAYYATLTIASAGGPVSLAGTITTSLTLQGVLARNAGMAGNIQLQTSMEPIFGRAAAMISTATSESTLVAGLTRESLLQSALITQSLQEGSVSRSASLTANIQMTSAIVEALQVARSAQGNLTTESQILVDLSVMGVVTLVAMLTTQSQLSATLHDERALASLVTSITTMASAIERVAGMTSVGAVQSSIQAGLARTAAMMSQLSNESEVTTSLARLVGLLGTVQDTSAVAGLLHAERALTALLQHESQMLADLTIEGLVSLAAALQTQSQISSALSSDRALAALVTNLSTLVAAIARAAAMTATVQSESTIPVTLSALRAMTSDVTSDSDLDAGLAISAGLYTQTAYRFRNDDGSLIAA